MNKRSMRAWSEANPDFFLDMLRVFVGLLMCLKSAAYLKDPESLVHTMTSVNFPFASVWLAKYVAVTHLVGGLLMTFGILTRAAAAIQLPNVLGAVFLVHLHEGLQNDSQPLAFASLVLVVLLVCAFGGSGRWSADWYFTEHRRAQGSLEPAHAHGAGGGRSTGPSHRD